MDTSAIITILICAAILLLIFIIGRAVSLWYWKIDERIEHLADIKQAIMQQKELQQQQLEIMELLLQKQGIAKVQIQDKKTGEISTISLEKWRDYWEKKNYRILNVV